MKRLYILCLFIFLGQSLFSQTVGTQGEVRWRYWADMEHITGTFTDFYVMERFPNGPDYVRTLNSISTPLNYNDYYGSQLRGFIHSETGGKVVFNLTADDEAAFLLSTDATAENLDTIRADTTNLTNLDTITLQANQHYYFEINHVEFAGWDMVILDWKADFFTEGISAEIWRTVGGSNIFDTTDNLCPLQGTSCDDGDPNTQNDIEDGNCHCIGMPITTNNCVGERGLVEAYIYDGLGGNHEVHRLDSLININAQPDDLRSLEPNFWSFIRDGEDGHDDFGMYIQAYLKVPVTGLYIFNLTGSDENIIYLSSDDSPTHKESNIMRNYWWTGPYGHDVGTEDDWDPGQTSDTLLLDANQYYYIEVHHRGLDTWEFFNLFWKTPYQTHNQWVRIPTVHFYDYTCETMCLKAGTPCDDGDPYTANDQWDGNCNCAGTPCVAPDCDDPSTSYLPPDECETTNLLDNRADDGWLSCTPLSAAPNPARTGQHWIKYDFGQLYNLGTTQVWNYNADGATAAGFQQVVVDYSTDGIYWEELGTYSWDLANGLADYEGFVGPDFTNITAQYVLISSMDDPNSCRGFSKIAFNAVACPEMQFNTPRIDQTLIDANSILVDITANQGEAPISTVALYLDDNWIASDNTAPYNWQNLTALQNLSDGDYKLSAIATDTNGTECELSTEIHLVSIENIPCDPNPLTIDTTDASVYRTEQSIISSSVIPLAIPVDYIAETEITLMPGFSAPKGSLFSARLADCTPANSLAEATQAKVVNLSANQVGEPEVNLYPNPVVNNFKVAINAHETGTMELRIFNVLGKEMSGLTRKQSIEKGSISFELPANALTSGLYYCKIKIGDTSFTKSFVKVDNQ